MTLRDNIKCNTPQEISLVTALEIFMTKMIGIYDSEELR
jgi:hypothetical protein